MADLDGAEKTSGPISDVTTLKDRLIAMIRADGPMPVSAYMNTCLHDPGQGYYATRPGLGTDFITAPETSQIFGELLGLWAAHEWQTLGAPDRLNLTEIGPGRGTLMNDALRAGASIPAFAEAIDLHLIEPSPVLQAGLKQRLGQYTLVFLPELDAIPASAPSLILANEWLDCLPARQFVQDGEDWHERVVGLDDDALVFGLRPQASAPEGSPRGACEIQTALETLVATLQQHFTETTGRALFIDYGPEDAAPNDTLRAYQGGQQVHPLAAPGLSDLTVDVDFARLKRLALGAGLSVHGPVPQGQFLLALGAEARMNQLARAEPAETEALYAGLRKLVDPAQMGSRFKAICISSHGLPAPAGF